MVFSDLQALRSVFVRKGIHGRLVRLLDLLAEYEFDAHYRKGFLNGAADFLFKRTHGDQGVDGYDEGDLVNLIVEEEVSKRILEYFETDLQDVTRRLAGVSLENQIGTEKAGVACKAVTFALCEGRLFRSGQTRLLVVVPQSKKTKNFAFSSRRTRSLGYGDHIMTSHRALLVAWQPGRRRTIRQNM